MLLACMYTCKFIPIWIGMTSMSIALKSNRLLSMSLNHIRFSYKSFWHIYILTSGEWQQAVAVEEEGVVDVGKAKAADFKGNHKAVHFKVNHELTSGIEAN